MASSGVWIKDGESISGEWEYLGNDRFHIRLDATCKYRGREIAFTVVGDDPDFSGWKLVEGEGEVLRASKDIQADIAGVEERLFTLGAALRAAQEAEAKKKYGVAA